jgi:hypothetical protein
MAIYVPTSVINSEEQQTVSRASIRRLIQGGQGIVPAANATAQSQALANATSAGISLSAANPLFVFRSDTGTLRAYDGATWVDVLPPDTGWVDVVAVSSWSSSTVQVRRVGNVVCLRGRLKKASGTIASGSNNTSLLTLPAGFRPASSFVAAGAGYVSGSGAVYGQLVTVRIYAEGVLDCHNANSTALSEAYVDGISFPLG